MESREFCTPYKLAGDIIIRQIVLNVMPNVPVGSKDSGSTG